MSLFLVEACIEFVENISVLKDRAELKSDGVQTLRRFRRAEC
jgi:hypothetical protein